MKWIVLTAMLISSTAWAATFNERGVWQPVSTATLAKNQTVTFGCVDVSDRKQELNVMVYGKTGDDSLNIILELRGMMTPNLSDSNLSVQTFTITKKTGGDVIAYADTLTGNQMYPYLMGRITNVDGDSTLRNVDVWLYMNPRELVFSGGN